MSQTAVESGLTSCWRSTDVSAEQLRMDDGAKPASTVAAIAAEASSVESENARLGECAVRRAAVCACPIWKRAMDIIGAMLLVIALAPLYLAVVVYIKVVSRGPVLYRQRRYGLGGRPFRVWKFRTIEESAESDQHRSHVADLMANNGTLAKRDHTLHVIPGGRLLRKLGIDELPQLINVMKGEMSLVGPRPDVVPYDEYAGRYQRRFDVLPGITGLWQVKGKNSTTFTEMMQLDLTYVRRRSFLLDVSILFMTLPALIAD